MIKRPIQKLAKKKVTKIVLIAREIWEAKKLEKIMLLAKNMEKIGKSKR